MSLADSVGRWLDRREQARGAQLEADAAQRALESTAEWRTWQAAIEAYKLAKGLAEIEEDIVRENAVNQYNETGQKHPVPGVEIRIYEVLRYDEDAALRYCTAHLPKALRLDVRAFERAAKVLDLEFVRIDSEPRAALSTELRSFAVWNA